MLHNTTREQFWQQILLLVQYWAVAVEVDSGRYWKETSYNAHLVMELMESAVIEQTK